MSSPDSSPRSRPDLSALRMQRSEPSRRSKGRRRAVGLLAVAALLALAAFALPWPWRQPKLETTTALSVTPQQASTVLTATGYTYARSRAAVGAKIIGRVVSLHVDEGDKVERGAILAVLDSDELKANLLQSEARVAEAVAQLADAEREAKRQERLFAAGVGAEADLDAARTRVDVTQAQKKTAEAELATSKARLDYAILRAPIDGVILERSVEVGEMVAPGGFTSQQSTGSLLRMADLNSLEVEADINESYIARLRLGQPATISVDAVPGVSYHGSLRQIVPTADRQRAVVQVKVTIDDKDERLVPDMSCNVSFLEAGTAVADLQAEPKILVPESAVLREGAAAFVWQLRDGRVHKLAVVLGAAQGDQVEIASGLSGGETIARDASRALSDGQRVRS